jgi:hypothetical protein
MSLTPNKHEPAVLPVIKKFKKQYRMAKKAAKSMSEQNVRFKINFAQGEGLKICSELPPEPEISRFAAVLRPLAYPDSSTCYVNIASIIINNTSIRLPESEQDTIRALVKKVARGPIQLRVDADAFQASQIYRLMADGEVFNEAKDASDTLNAMKRYPPISPVLLHQFYSYCCEVFNLCGQLFEYIERIEAAKENSDKLRSKTNLLEQAFQCIYCLRTDGGFSSEEHIYPESIGTVGDDPAILDRGYVCDRCNNGVLSVLDKYLIEHEFISFLRVLYAPYTKKGKFPIARYRNLTIKKIHPRKISINLFENTLGGSKVEESTEGSKIHLEMIGKSKFNPQNLGRSLYKIAIGMLSWENGIDRAIDKKYDPARRFILGGGGFPNKLLINFNIEPQPSIETNWFLLNPGTLFILNIFGVVFIFNLEETPSIELPPELEQMGFRIFDLATG